MTTLRYDRTRKATVYARARIADYWILNLKDRCLELLRDPIEVPAGSFVFQYKSVVTLKPGQSVEPLARPGVQILVADLLP